MSDLTKQSELKNCPFCGCSTPVLNPPFADIGFKGSINCPACLAEMPRESDEAELILCWNTRSASAGVREALEELLRKSKDKREQVEHYRVALASLDHAKTIAGGRVLQLDQVIDWIDSALSDHGVLESAAEAITKSDGGERSYCRGCGNQSYDNKFGCSICDIDAERPSDSLLSKTLTEGEKKRPQIETSPANEGSQPSLTTDADLLALLDRARNHVMTPNERYEQRRSFLRGMCPSHRDYADWCAQVDKHVPPLADAVSRTETTGGAV